MINKKNELKQIILGSILISFSLVLSKINNLFIRDIHFVKMPFSQVSFWAFWYFPLIIICLFFSFYYSFLFILIYIILFSYFFSFPNYVIMNDIFFNNSKELFCINIIFMELFGSIIPVLCYLFLSFFIKIKKTRYNFNKIVFIFILIILCQSISKVRVGWFFVNFYKKQFKINFNIKIFFIIFFYNFIPVCISNIINFILFLFLKTKIIKLYDYYLER